MTRTAQDMPDMPDLQTLPDPPEQRVTRRPSHEGLFHIHILIMIITIDRLTNATRSEAIREWRTLRTFSQTLQAKDLRKISRQHSFIHS